MVGELRAGRVESYDSDAGLGVVVDDDGQRVPFHCTAITDGTREIDPGRPVAFVVGPGGPGRWEATAVRPLG